MTKLKKGGVRKERHTETYDISRKHGNVFAGNCKKIRHGNMPGAEAEGICSLETRKRHLSSTYLQVKTLSEDVLIEGKSHGFEKS